MKEIFDDVLLLVAYFLGMSIVKVSDAGWGSIFFGTFLIAMILCLKHIRTSKRLRKEIKK